MRVRSVTGTHTALPDVSADQHHTLLHGAAQHTTGFSVLDRKVADTSVSNTNAETDLYRKTIAANTIGATGQLRLTLYGDRLGNNAGGTATMKIKFGATTVFTSTVFPLAGDTASGVRRYWRVQVLIQNVTTASQRLWEDAWAGEAPASNFSTHVPGSSNQENMTLGYGTSAEDTTLAKDLAVTIQMSLATVNQDWVVHGALLELVV